MNIQSKADKEGTFYNEQGMAISYNAYHALYAARIRKQVGRYMAMAYALKRGVPASLFRLACQLVATEQKTLDFTKGNR